MPCLFPFQKDGVPLPCGKCPQCLKRRTDSWIFRLLQEDKVRSSALFVTLTYDTGHVPISERGFMTLCKRDWQLFMKRFRKLHPPGVKISYYAVGEYGSNSFRPHFHAILFDADKEFLDQAWSLGDVHVGDVSGASVAYTAKYINKGKIVGTHRHDDRIPEFSLMSKRLGLSYLSPAVCKWHTDDLSRNYVLFDGGQKSALPRYFRDKIFSAEQKELQVDIIEASGRQAGLDHYNAFLKRTKLPDTRETLLEYHRSVNESRRNASDSLRKSFNRTKI